MDPKGHFSGDTLTTWWAPVQHAARYLVIVEQCNDTLECRKVVDIIVNDTRLEMTSADHFGPCTFYTLKVLAQDAEGQRMLKETALLSKDHHECNQNFYIMVGIIMAVLTLLALALIIVVMMYFLRKDPVQRLQRARSRVYSRLYSRDRYMRPFDKVNLAHEMELHACNSEAHFEAEFADLEQLAVDTIQRRLSQSTIPGNRRRNRYQDIVPFDRTRVTLERPVSIKGDSEPSNYINASFISDLSGQLFSPAYIAAQGPNEDTIDIFWEMIWQQNVRVIVMLTNLIEGLGFHSNKCSQYWPELVGNTRRCHDIEIQLYDCQEAPDYLVRKLDVSRLETSREIVHIQCTAWPDRSAPKEAAMLLQLIDVVRMLSVQYTKNLDQQPPGPWLVHCSAGVGRTGTFIALDQLLRMYDTPSKSEVDVFNTVYQLRKERRYLVQTLAQYTYLYKCLHEHGKRKKELHP